MEGLFPYQSPDDGGRGFIDQEAQEVNEPSTSRGTRERFPPPPSMAVMSSSDETDNEVEIVRHPKRKRVIISSSESSDTDALTRGKERVSEEVDTPRPRRKMKERVRRSSSMEDVPCPKRRLRLCPVPGCRSKPQKKLSNHLSYAHPAMTASEHQQALSNAKVVEPAQANAPGLRPIRHQATLERSLQKAVGPSRVEAMEKAHGSGTTRSFASFSDQHPIMVSFVEWLQGVDGREKGPVGAVAIMRDVSKYLQFAHPLKLSLETLVHKNTILQFVDA